MTATPLDAVRSGYAAFARGDGPAVLHGVFMKLGTEWEGWSAVPQPFITQDDVVVALGDYGGRCRATGKSFSAPFVHVWTFRGGKVVRLRQHTDTVLVRAAMQA